MSECLPYNPGDCSLDREAGPLQNRWYVLLSRCHSVLDLREAIAIAAKQEWPDGDEESRMCDLFFNDPAFLSNAAITLHITDLTLYLMSTYPA